MPHPIHTNNATIHGRVKKPVLNRGDRVYSAWWPDNNWKKPATWWPGIITAVDVRYDVDHGYGPLRLYGVLFDDGYVLNNVEDVYVFPKEEYELTTSSSDEQHCMIRNIVDADSQDGWARIVGWYEFSCGQGSVRSFPLLCDALDAYQQSTIASNRNSPESGAGNEHINAYVCGRWLQEKEEEFRCGTESSPQSTNRSFFMNEADPIDSKAAQVEIEVLSTNRVDISFYGTAAFWPSSNSKVFDSSIPSPSAILRELVELEEPDEIIPLKRSTPPNIKSREPRTFGTDLHINTKYERSKTGCHARAASSSVTG